MSLSSLRRSARVDALRAAHSASPGSGVSPRRPNVIPTRAARSSKSTKASAASTGKDDSAAELPSTPPRKRRRTTSQAQSSAPAPATPTAVRLMTVPGHSSERNDVTPPPVHRPAEPHRTNALLISPETSRVVAYSDEVTGSSPTNSSLPQPTTTTGSLLEEACAHLIRVDPRLKPVIEKHPCHLFSPEGLAEQIDPFQSLTTGIIGQQVRGGIRGR